MTYRRQLILILAILLLVAAASPAGAGEYLYSKDSTIIGSIRTYIISDSNESLIELARKYDLGYNEIVDANPGLDPFVPGAGSVVVIPSSWILPEVKEYKGIVINLSELRLYYFSGKGAHSRVVTFPIGIGSQGTETPLGTFGIIEKIVHPAWYVPASIRKEHPELPPVVPPGPDNPMGSHALRLSVPSVLIHGTDRPYAVGRKASHGCLRLYPEDIPRLFKMVPVGMRVTIVRQPVKVSVKADAVYMEVHKDETIQPESYYKTAIAILAKKQLLSRVSSRKLLRVIREKSGIPVDISSDGPEDIPPAEMTAKDNSLRKGSR